MNKILVSICIPTYNRAFYLEKCLQSITSQPGFDNAIEIVISDNCSTDNTAEVVTRFQNTFNNIRYFKNEVNEGMEKNFARVLSLGNGCLLKLLNDYMLFNEGAVSFLKANVLENIKLKPVLFYLTGKLKRDYKDEQAIVYNVNDFLGNVSYWSTWLSSFSIWKDDFDNIVNMESHFGSMFFHTSLLFENISRKKEAVIFNQKLFELQEVASKGGYDLFEVFINGYLNDLLIKLYNKGDITSKVYEKEKTLLLKCFLLPFYYRLIDKPVNPEAFNNQNALNVIYKNYGASFLIHLSLIQILKGYIKKLVKLKQKNT